MEAIISVLIGGVLALAGGFLTRLFETCREKRVLKRALAGEISAVTKMLQELTMPKLSELAEQTCPSQVLTSPDYFIVYDNNSSKIGYLEAEAAQEVVQFYTHAKFLMQELHDYTHSPYTAERAVNQTGQLLGLCGRVAELGKRAAAALDK